MAQLVLLDLGPKDSLEALCCVLEQDTFILYLVVLVQTGNCPNMTEKLLTGS